MKKLVEVVQVEGEGLDGLLGQEVLLLCQNYFYTGKLVGVNDTFVKLEKTIIVYETGTFSSKGYKDAQTLHTSEFYINRAAIEAFGVSK
jgi:hypothetical protein